MCAVWLTIVCSKLSYIMQYICNWTTSVKCIERCFYCDLNSFASPYPLPVSNSFLFPSSHTHTCAARRCEAETTGLLFWPATISGTTRTLQCPNTTTMISRTCSLSGVWDSVDLTLCTLFTSINTVSFAAPGRTGLVLSLEKKTVENFTYYIGTLFW